MAGSLSISDEDALYLNRLNTGHALCHKEGMERPIECAVSDDVKSHAISDQKIQRIMSNLNTKTLHSFETYELAALLKNDGKELTLKFLNSLCTVNSGKVNELVSSAKKELRKLLVLGNIHTRFNETVFADYIAKQIFELLNKGIYCKVPKLPENLKQTLLEVINKPDEGQHGKLLICFNELWNVSEAKLFITEVVENLSFKHLVQNKSDFAIEDVKSIVSSFFIVPDEKLVEIIAHNLTDQKGTAND